MSIIKPEFGAEKRHTARRLRELVDLDALHEVNIRNNPLPYLERASERIFRLEEALFEANAVLKNDAPSSSAGTLQVEASEYERLRKCRAIIENAFARLVTHKVDGRHEG